MIRPTPIGITDVYSESKKSLNTSPMTAVGIVATMIITPSFLTGRSASRSPFPVHRSLMVRQSSTMSAQMSFQYTIKTEIRVPTCSSTANSSTLSSETPKACCRSARCPELLIGKNSAKPCTRPNMTASK